MPGADGALPIPVEVDGQCLRMTLDTGAVAYLIDRPGRGLWARDRAQTHAGTAGGSRGFGPDVDAHADGEGLVVKVGRLAVGIEEARSAAARVDMRGTPAAIYDGVV